MAETYIERLQRERGVLLDALSAVVEYQEAREKAEATVFKHDAMNDADRKRETMQAKIQSAMPLIKGGTK